MSYKKISFPYIEAPEDELPSEGYQLIATDGEQYAHCYFIWSGEYRFSSFDEYRDDLGFNPTHWIYVEYLEDELNL